MQDSLSTNARQSCTQHERQIAPRYQSQRIKFCINSPLHRFGYHTGQLANELFHAFFYEACGRNEVKLQRYSFNDPVCSVCWLN